MELISLLHFQQQHLDNLKNKIKPYAKLATTTGVKMVTAGALNLDNVNLDNVPTNGFT